MVRNKNFSFGFTEDIYEFIVLRDNYGKVRSRLHNVCRV